MGVLDRTRSGIGVLVHTRSGTRSGIGVLDHTRSGMGVLDHTRSGIGVLDHTRSGTRSGIGVPDHTRSGDRSASKRSRPSASRSGNRLSPRGVIWREPLLVYFDSISITATPLYVDSFTKKKPGFQTNVRWTRFCCG